MTTGAVNHWRPFYFPWHNRPMIYSAGDLGVEIDYQNDQPGAECTESWILTRLLTDSTVLS